MIVTKYANRYLVIHSDIYATHVKARAARFLEDHQAPPVAFMQQ